jgi:Arc/MetJ-type ribon-helix-helix transcriptional regulator
VDPLVNLRIPLEMTKAIDAWAARNDKASRSEAIRALIERGLRK